MFLNIILDTVHGLSAWHFRPKRELCQKALYTVTEYLEDKKAWD